MILKFVYAKEIHVYDLKQQESFDQACDKIRLMFKRLPDQFVLVYRNSEQLELQIDSNEQFDQLISNLKSNVKMIKLFITDINDRKYKPIHPLSEQQVPRQNLNNSSAQSSQMVGSSNCRFEQESGNFTDLNEPQEETQAVIECQYQKIQNQDKKEFQQLESSDEEENQVQRQVKNYLQNKIQYICLDEERELDKNDHENSDPHQILNRGQIKQSQKENLYNQLEEKPQQRDSIINQQKASEVNPHSIHLSGTQKLPLSERKKIFEPYEPKPKSQSEDVRCHRAKCDMCQATPIIGVRYKCVVCEDYDLCEKCEQYHAHQHPLLKICFNYQTPISIKVQIPEISQKIQKQHQIVLQKFDTFSLDEEQRRQRVVTMASELSDLLDIDFQQCADFIRQNEQYTKQTLTQLLISRKNGNKLIKDKKVKNKNKNEEKNYGINDILINIKGMFKGVLSK